MAVSTKSGRRSAEEEESGGGTSTKVADWSIEASAAVEVAPGTIVSLTGVLDSAVDVPEVGFV